MKIALIQFPVTADKQDNLNRAAESIRQAAQNGADMAVLPEMFCCPYETSNFPLYAEKEGGATWQFAADLARRLGVYLSAGSMPEADEAGCIYNTAYVFDRQGKQIAKHRKMHLFDINVKGGQAFQESLTLTPGNEVTVFDTEFGRMGVCACFDFRFPELSRLLALRGAQVIFVPAAFNMTTGPAHWELTFRSQALYNQVFTVGTAPARDLTASYHSWGHSIVVDPWGTVVSQMDETPDFRMIEIDPSCTGEIREQLPLLRHRREDVYQLTQLVFDK